MEMTIMEKQSKENDNEVLRNLFNYIRSLSDKEIEDLLTTAGIDDYDREAFRSDKKLPSFNEACGILKDDD